jgi:hypothetical protein
MEKFVTKFAFSRFFYSCWAMVLEKINPFDLILTETLPFWLNNKKHNLLSTELPPYFCLRMKGALLFQIWNISEMAARCFGSHQH